MWLFIELSLNLPSCYLFLYLFHLFFVPFIHLKKILKHWYFSSLCIIFSCFFACHVIFDWTQNIINLILLDTGYVCISVNTLGFCSDSQRSYLARVWYFQVRRTIGLILPYSEAKLFSVIYPVNYTVFHSSCCEHIILGPSHMSHMVLPLILLGASFPGLRQLPHKCALINHQLAEDLKETFWESLGLSLRAAHSSLVLYLENSSSLHLPGLQTLSSTPGRLPGSAWVSASVLLQVLETLPI